MGLRGKDLRDAMSDIDGRFIEEAVYPLKKEKKRFRLTGKTAAAMVSAAAAIGIIAIGLNNMKDLYPASGSYVSESAQIKTEVPEEMSMPEIAGSVEMDAPAAEEEYVSDMPTETAAEPAEGKPEGAVSGEAPESVPESTEAYYDDLAGICIPAPGYAIRSEGSENEDGIAVYRLIIYGMIPEEEMRNANSAGFYDNGYGDISLSSRYHELIDAEAERLRSLGVDAKITDEGYIAVTLKQNETEDFPCAEGYGYRLEPLE